MAEMERMNNHRRGRHTSRDENDFSPGGGGPTSTRPTKQLEFHQAMSDFKKMFPNMDEEVIEAVLRANNGIVDATIDQLLTMNVDNEVFPEELQWEDEAALAAGLSLQSILEHDSITPKSKKFSSEKPPLADPVGESPPPYSEAVQSPQMLISPGIKKPVRQSPSNPPTAHLLDLDIDDLALSNTEPKTPISSWNGPVASPSSSWNRRHLSEKSWSVGGPSGDMQRKPPPASSWGSAASASSGKKFHGRSLSMGSSVKKAYRNWNPPMLGTLPEDFLRLSPIRSPPQRSPPQRSLSMGSADKPQHRRTVSQPVRTMSTHSHQFSPDMLQERIRENERRRRMALMSDHDPEQAQYLEDERIALALQNSEFLQELRDNQDFMKTLERDRMNEVAFEPTTSPASPEKDDMMEGYGDRDRDSTLEAFPFSQQLPKMDDEDAELRRKLKHMGKASRKQFAALARKFFSRKKKKSSKQIMREKLAPSRMNLLEEDRDSDEFNTRGAERPYDERPEFDPLPQHRATVPSIRTVQRPPYHPETIITYSPDSSHAV